MYPTAWPVSWAWLLLCSPSCSLINIFARGGLGFADSGPSVGWPALRKWRGNRILLPLGRRTSLPLSLVLRGGWGARYDTQQKILEKWPPGDPPPDPPCVAHAGPSLEIWGWAFAWSCCCCSPRYRWPREPPPLRPRQPSRGARAPARSPRGARALPLTPRCGARLPPTRGSLGPRPLRSPLQVRLPLPTEFCLGFRGVGSPQVCLFFFKLQMQGKPPDIMRAGQTLTLKDSWAGLQVKSYAWEELDTGLEKITSSGFAKPWNVQNAPLFCKRPSVPSKAPLGIGAWTPKEREACAIVGCGEKGHTLCEFPLVYRFRLGKGTCCYARITNCMCLASLCTKRGNGCVDGNKNLGVFLWLKPVNQSSLDIVNANDMNSKTKKKKQQQLMCTLSILPQLLRIHPRQVNTIFVLQWIHAG